MGKNDGIQTDRPGDSVSYEPGQFIHWKTRNGRAYGLGGGGFIDLVVRGLRSSLLIVALFFELHFPLWRGTWGKIEPTSQLLWRLNEQMQVSTCIEPRSRWEWSLNDNCLVSCHWIFPKGLCSPPLPGSQLNMYSHCLNSSPSTSHPTVLLQGNPINAAPATFTFRVRKGCLSCLDPEAAPRFPCFASNWVTDRQATASLWPGFLFCTIVGCHALQSPSSTGF